MSKKHVQIRLDMELYKKLQHYVVDRETTVQKVVADLIKELVEGEDANK